MLIIGCVLTCDTPCMLWWSICIVTLASGACHGASGPEPDIVVHSAEHATQLSQLLTCGHTDAEARSNLKQHQDSQWGTDVLIQRWLSRSPSQAMHAHLHFVPSHAKCIDNAHIQSIRELNLTFERALGALPSLRCGCKLALEGAAHCMCSMRCAQQGGELPYQASTSCGLEHATTSAGTLAGGSI